MARSVMRHKFAEVPRVKIPRSTFNRSTGLKTTFDADGLYPIFVDDVIPGDTLSLKANIFCRLATPLFPIMDNMYLETFWFFCPYRLVWSNWERFMGAQDDPGDSIDYTIPVHSNMTPANASLAHYLGLPVGTALTGSRAVSALPARIYRLIWDDWFRDQDLQDAQIRDGVFGTDWGGDGPDASIASGGVLVRGKRHDYFTSARPWPQKGTAVSLPLGTSADIHTGVASGGDVEVYSTAQSEFRRLYTPATPPDYVALDTLAGADSGNKLFADLSGATAATINDLRLAFQTQRLLERDARSGTRYVESIMAHYGVTVPDFRLQRPEFLGGGSSRINITPVAQTTYQGTPTDEDTKGALAGFGTVSGTHGFTASFVEHGLVMGLVNVRSDITYSQGIERYWSKSTRYDFYYPVLAQIGEQAILAKEIYVAASDPDAVFGYTGRYDEYRYKPARLTGRMDPNVGTTLAAWHLSEDFTSEPTLGDTFIQSNTSDPLDRAIAVSTEPHFIGDFFFDIKHARPMPLYGVPGNLDHF